MLPFFNMRLYRNGNMAILQPFIEKMKRGELTLENILEEDEIIQDLKTNPNSQFINMLSNAAIRQLIDYATKMPKSDEKNIGYKYPFNATEILCCDNNAVMERIMNEMRMGEDSDDEEDEKEEPEKENKEEDNSDDDKKKEENEEFFEVKEDEHKEQEPLSQEKEEEKEQKTEEVKPEIKNEEQTQEKKEEEPKEEAPKEEVKEEPKKEEQKEGEAQPQPEEQKPEEKKEEPKPEEAKKEEPKPEELKPEEPKPEEPKPEETKKEGEQPQPTEEPKKEETQNKEEEKPKEEAQPEKQEEPAKEEVKEEPPKEQEKKEELQKPEKAKEGEQKPEDENKEEAQSPAEILNKSENAEDVKQEESNAPKNEEENAEDQKPEDNEVQRNEEEEQEKEDEEQPKEVTIIYDNVDYLLGFLNESEETKSNYVLVGYFYKIVNHLLNSQSIKIVQYLFDYPKKNEFDVLGLIIKNMKRKSMGELVNKLLLFQEEGADDFLPKKFELLEKVLEELKETKEEDKYECICATLETTFYNKGFFIEFMKETKFLDLLYVILEKSQEDPKKLIAVLRLLINVHENILKNLDERITVSVAQENPMDFLSMFNGTYGLDEANTKDLNPELQQVVDKVFENLIILIKKSNFNFLNDLDDYSAKENSEFMSTYQVPQKKLGMKKLLQIEFFRSILDILVNAYAKFDVEDIRDTIISIINIAQEKKLFWKMHKLFFDFPFCNLYQSFYIQIFDIILNEHSPKELINYTFVEKEGENEKNLIQIFIDKVLNDMYFKFTSGRISFHPNYSFEVSILNKINASTNEYLKELIKDNKNLEVFDQILGQEIDTIFNQKLLLNEEKDIQLGPNIGLDKEETPLQYFGKKNFMELLEQDNAIYGQYLKGEDYLAALSEKKEQEKQEKEERQKLEEKDLNEGGEEEMVSGLGDSINIIDDNKNNAVEQEEAPKVEEEEAKEKPDTGTEDVSEETEEEKSFNDVNYWKSEIKPDDDIMSAMLNDLD